MARVASSKTASIAVQLEKSLEKRRDMSWHDYLIAMLHLGSALEHTLMVQYLYAAYSLGGEQVPVKHRPMVQRWQETILAVAREEMGHLLTVQNVLTLLGAGLSLNRGNFPWAMEWFDFEPLTLGSLACYVYAEMPVGEHFPEKGRIERLARAHLTRNGKKLAARLRPVGEVYTDIMKLLGDPDLIPDAAFREESYVRQASWDDWGRGYKPDPRPLDPDGNLEKISAMAQRAAQFRAHVMIDRSATRTQALAALQRLSIQGEGPMGSEKADEWSHFKRFIKIFREFDTIKDEKWSPIRAVPVNPTADKSAGNGDGYISSLQSRNWANLFNLRYRMLLTYLLHTFQVARVTLTDEPGIRALLMHKVFGEMYNLKSIAGILVQRPQHEGDALGADTARAGPPFELPYNLRLPAADEDCWCLHLDILCTVSVICRTLQQGDLNPQESAYLATLMDLDAQTVNWIKRILAGMNSTEGYSA
jgi:Ferritin-like